MHIYLTYATYVSLVALIGWSFWFILVDRAVIFKQLIFAMLIEVMLIAQAILGLVQTIGGYTPNEGHIVYWGYVITGLIMLPIAGLWAFAERTRWSSVVLTFASVTLLVLQWRIVEIWLA